MSETQRRRLWKKGVNDSDDDDEEEKVEEKPRKRKADPKTRLVSRKKVKSLIDDAAELSGSDASGDEEEEDESEEDAVDYERDGFVVDEEASETRRHELEDSDSESDSDSASAGSSQSSNPQRRRRVQRLRDVAALDEEDLALIEEAKHSTEELPESEPAAHAPLADQQQRQKTITATSEAELRKELFLDSEDEDEPPASRRPPIKAAAQASRRNKPTTTFDEDGLDDFIDYQEDDDAYLDADQRREAMENRRLLYLNELQQDSAHRRSTAGVTQAQLQEATDIFGDEYLDIMASRQRDVLDDEDDWMDTAVERNRMRKTAVRERGVGVEYGLESSDEDLEYDEDLEGDDEDDLSQDSEDPTLSTLTPLQRTEAKRLAREKKRLDKQERRRLAVVQKAERRKARLKKAFEPVQLMHHFCTDKDDLIRSKDEPERFFDWNTPFHGPPSKQGQGVTTALSDAISEEEIEEALWIMGRIPSIASEFFNAVFLDQNCIKAEQDVNMDLDSMPKNQKAILDSISYALRFMHRENLEPEFIRRYRADIVTSPAVRDHLYTIMDDDAEWERFIIARNKVQQSLQSMTSLLDLDKARGSEAEQLDQLRESVQKAQERYDQSIQQETNIRLELGRLTASDDSMDQDAEDDLFGHDDQEGPEQPTVEDEEKTILRKQKESLRAHLTTAETLSQVCAEQLEVLSSSLQALEHSQLASGHDFRGMDRQSKKISIDRLLNQLDYQQYLTTITEYRHAMDIYGYLSLLKEGNEAIFKKSSVQLHDSNNIESALINKRSKRFDRDFYRTCVSEGLRAVCYKFILAPYRVGIMLEENLTKSNRFNWDLALPGENDTVDPKNWIPPVIDDADPALFASDLVGSGELILLSSSTNATDIDLEDHPELKDPLRGCRYVAATELAYEPRVRRYLRSIYRSQAVLTTVPTKKGLESIDAFHEFYGIHLIHNKPIKDHFPMDPKESEERMKFLTFDERKVVEEENRNRERDSCMQYLNILKAERTGFIQVFVHLPLDDQQDNRDVYWYRQGSNMYTKKQSQNKSALMETLETIYLPPNGDTDEWNEERRKVLRLALSKFLLPHFEAEVKRDLLETSVRKGVQAAGKNMLAMAMEGPYRPSHMLSDNRFLVPTGDLPVVGFIGASDGKEAAFLAAVSERGDLNDYLGIAGSAQIDDISMREKIITFLMMTRPAFVAVGTSIGLFSRLAARKLSEMVSIATERWNNRGKQGQDEDDDDFEERMKIFRQKFPDSDDNSDIQWKCTVDLVDDNVAQLFGRSVRGKKEFPDQALNLKCAVALARYAKDPLAELTYAWTVASDAGIFGTEILYLNVHPLQQILPKPLLLKEYSRSLSLAVAEVGVDLNVSCTYDHLHGLLTFVPGFGPRKAASLRQSLERLGGVIASRRELLAKRLVGPIVYNNAVAFLRIRPIDALSTALLHPLDDTRLHPDVYHRNNWATKIAIDALELSDTAGDSSADKEDLGINALRDIMKDSRKEVSRLFYARKALWEKLHQGSSFDIASWDPRTDVPNSSWRDKVEELDLEAFAELIERNRLGKWLSHLTMIKWEFRLPFADVRKPMEPLDSEKMFRLLTGETDLSLRAGREVTAKVLKNADQASYVQLEGELQGFIRLKDLSDGHVDTPGDIVQPGQIVTAVVTKVKKEHLSVDLSLKLEDLRKLPSSWERPSSLPLFDSYFDRLAAETLEHEMSIERERRLAAINVSLKKTKLGGDGNSGVDGASNTLRSGRVTRRACDHPAFRNAKNDEVDRELKGGGIGDALIRPSSKQADALVLHWHIRLGVVRVIEVAEEDKDNDASIGRILKIKNEAYGSIDELLSRYIMPLNERVQELVNHRKFLDLSEDDVDDKLKEMKHSTPSGIYYFFCWSEEYPDCASLRYIINSTRFHTVMIRPDGFIWCNRTFPSIEALSNEFKKNPRGTSSSVATSSRSLNSSLASSTKAVAYSAGPIPKPVSRWGARNIPAPPTTIPVMTPAYASVGAPVGLSTWSSTSLNHQGVMLPPPSRAPAVPPSLPLMPAQGYPLYPPAGIPPSGYPSYQ